MTFFSAGVLKNEWPIENQEFDQLSKGVSCFKCSRSFSIFMSITLIALISTSSVVTFQVKSFLTKLLWSRKCHLDKREINLLIASNFMLIFWKKDWPLVFRQKKNQFKTWGALLGLCSAPFPCFINVRHFPDSWRYKLVDSSCQIDFHQIAFWSRYLR